MTGIFSSPSAPDPVDPTSGSGGAGLPARLFNSARDPWSVLWPIVALLFYRILTLVLNDLPLYGDEAQYWVWSLDFAFGYYSKPPLVGWAIGAATSVCSDAEPCIRSVSTLAYSIGAVFVFLTGWRLFDGRTGFWSALVFLTLPGISFSSQLVSTDPLLLMCFAVGLYCYARADQGQAAGERRVWLWWLATGLAIGTGLLAKYAMAVFPASMLLYALLSPERKQKLKAPGFWLAILLGFAHLIPNILWQAENHFVTLNHTGDNANLGGSLFHPGQMAEFIGGQFLVFGPVLFGLLLYVLIRFGKSLLRQPVYRYLASFILPLLIIMTIQSFLSRANANWAAPVYVAASVLVTGLCLRGDCVGQKLGQYLLAGSLIFHATAMVVFYHWQPITRLAGIELTKGTDPYFRLRGWDDLGAAVAQRLQQYPDVRLLCQERMDIASFRYYARPWSDTAVKWRDSESWDDHFEITTTMEDKLGEDFLLVTRFDNFQAFSSRFESSSILEPIVIPLGGGREMRYNVMLLRGFQGYGREK